jgi:hypothetical protein
MEPRMKDKCLSKQIEKSNDSQAIDKMMELEEAGIHTRFAIAQNKSTQTLTLIKIAKKAKDKETISALLARESMKKPSDENDLVMIELLKKKALIDTTRLSLIVEQAFGKETLNYILTQGSAYLNPKLLSLIANKDKIDEDELQLIAQHPETSFNTLAFIAAKTKNLKTLQIILSHSPPQQEATAQQNKDNNTVYCAIANNSATPMDLLASIAKITTDELTLSAFLKRDDLNEEVYLTLASNPKTPKTLLLKIAQNTSSTTVINTLLTHIAKNESKEDLYLAIANNSATTNIGLIQIAKNSRINKTLYAVLKHQNLQHSSTINELVFQALAENIHLIEANSLNNIVLLAKEANQGIENVARLEILIEKRVKAIESIRKELGELHKLPTYPLDKDLKQHVAVLTRLNQSLKQFPEDSVADDINKQMKRACKRNIMKLRILAAVNGDELLVNYCNDQLNNLANKSFSELFSMNTEISTLSGIANVVESITHSLKFYSRFYLWGGTEKSVAIIKAMNKIPVEDRHLLLKYGKKEKSEVGQERDSIKKFISALSTQRGIHQSETASLKKFKEKINDLDKTDTDITPDPKSK